MLTQEKLLSYFKLDGLIEELEKKTDFQSRLQLTLIAIEKILPLDIKCEQKNLEESKELKIQADKLFCKEKGRVKQMLESWKLYCESIAKAEKLSVTIAQTYANRSATLFHLNKFEECIKDIDNALHHNYPDHLKANLLRRKAKCFKILGKLEVDEICEEARRWLENVNLTDKKIERLESKINNTKKIQQSVNLKIENTINEQTDLPEMIPNIKIPSASSAIEIKYNTDIGRYLITNRDIDTGEILVLEEPYTSLLSLENIYTHCSHCFVRAWNSIPCEYCIYAMYCSEECRKEAWTQYHDIECPIRGYLISMGMNELAPFSLKLTILAVRESGGIEQLRKSLNKIDYCQDHLMKTFTNEGIYCSNKYKPLYSLVTHEDKRKGCEILTLSLNAAFILYYMFTLTSFFENGTNKNLASLYNNNDALFVGKLIVRHFMIIQLNDHEFSEFRTVDENENEDDNFFRIGSVIGAVTSLINHSCNPNVSRCPILQDNCVKQVIYAICPIKKGSEIVDDYSCNFCFKSKSEREKILKQYFINCHCVACNGLWPMYEDLPSILSVVTDKEMRVDVSRAIVRSKQHKRTVFYIGLHRYHGDKAAILKSLANSISIVHESTKKPTQEYFELLEQFRQTFLQIHGNKFNLIN